MAKNPLSFIKIVPTPTPSSWSQAYNAGNLAVVVSLSFPEEIPSEVSLASLGRDVLNTLEAEYFTLETKNLTSIKQALLTTCEKIPQEIIISLSLAVIIHDVLYVCMYGKGRILMKRGSHLGTLLSQTEDSVLTGASGYIQHGDIVVLQTAKFGSYVDADALLPYLTHEKLDDLAESISPIIHEHQDGAAAAIIFSYKENAENEELMSKVEEEPNFHTEKEPTETENQEVRIKNKADKKEQEVEEKEPEKEIEKENFETVEETSTDAAMEETSDTPVVSAEIAKAAAKRRFSHSRKLYLTIACILGLVLIGSIFLFVQKEQKQKQQQAFTASVEPAQKKYQEGQSLMDLNKSLALSDFQQAHDMLVGVQSKFPASSTEGQQVAQLLGKVNDALTQLNNSNLVNANTVDAGNSPYLAILAKHTDAKASAQDDTNVYVVTDTEVDQINKSTQKEKALIKNGSDWKNAGGFGTYIGNFYLLDKSDGILKYTSPSSSSQYFASGVKPDLSNATGIAIDGDMWIITSDGSIMQFTKGKADSFNLKGLDKPLKNPRAIYTNVDSSTLYVLDNGNSRMVTFDKSGNYQAQYTSSVINTATGFDVDEKDKKVFVLSGGKIYEIDLK